MQIAKCKLQSAEPWLTWIATHISERSKNLTQSRQGRQEAQKNAIVTRVRLQSAQLGYCLCALTPLRDMSLLIDTSG
jgi:hypothetical protein